MSFPEKTSTTIPREFIDMEEPLIELAQRSRGDLRKLLFAFFGFLNRRTDFYCIKDGSAGVPAIGFPPGEAEKMLLAAFRQYPLRKLPSKVPAAPAPAPRKPSIKAKNEDKGTSETSVSSSPATTGTTTNTMAAESITEQPVADIVAQSSTKLPQPRLTDEGLQIPVGNGGVTESYTWTQTLEECTVLVPIHQHSDRSNMILRGKDLDVQIKPNSLLVQTKKTTTATTSTVILQGTLFHHIVPDESTWTLEDGIVQISLYKQQRTFWKSILQGDPEIDTSLVDNRRHITTYDAATQAQIRKIMHQQQQERTGAPQPPSPLDPTSLPPGVEYIDQEALDRKDNAAKT